MSKELLSCLPPELRTAKLVLKFERSVSNPEILTSWSFFIFSSTEVNRELRSLRWSFYFVSKSFMCFSRVSIRFIVLSGCFLLANISISDYISIFEFPVLEACIFDCLPLSKLSILSFNLSISYWSEFRI